MRRFYSAVAYFLPTLMWEARLYECLVIQMATTTFF